MEISEKIKQLERYNKALCDFGFTVYSKGKQVTVRLGKKYTACVCPDKASAEVLAEALNMSIRTKQGQVDEVLSLLGQRCEQLSLPLFKGEDGNGKTQGHGDQPEGLVSDTTGAVAGGPEKPQD